MADEKIKDLRKLIEICRKTGVKRLKSADFEFELSDLSLFPVSSYQKKKDSREVSEENFQKLTPEQILFYSTFDPSEFVPGEIH